MDYKQLDNLIYTYKRGGRGTGKTRLMLSQAWRWGNEGKDVIVVSESDSSSGALREVFHKQYDSLAIKSPNFVSPRFVAMDRFSNEEGQWKNNIILVDPDVWVRLLQESASTTLNEKEKVWIPSPGFLGVIASRNNQLRDAGLLSHTYEQQELAQWKGIAIAMSNLILKHVK